MTDTDPAFLWETEALRSGAQRTTEVELDDAAAEPRSGKDEPGSGNWVTLRMASQSTGIPVETLRKWARRATIPTYLTPTAAGTNIRMVDLDGIVARAADLGRPLHPPPTETEPPPVTRASAPVPEGTMIVPVDAWNKMLNQLGNLHEAGQHLAEARERAAKAETEAKFLRERLAELRQDPVPPAPQPTGNDPVISADVAAEPPEKVWHYLIRRVRDRGDA
ncbi:MAG: hypothetical protein GY788_30290 [bacterium]|nr:hypothetical protein [bacterium]